MLTLPPPPPPPSESLRLPPTAASLRREEDVDGSGDGLAIADAPVASEVVVTVVAIGIFCAFCGASGMCVCGGDCSSGGASRWRCFSAAAAAALAAALALLLSFELDFDEMSLAVVLEEGLVLPGAGDGDFTPPSSFFRPDSLIFAPGMADDGWTLPWWCPLSRLRLESLRSLRADEKPLLELVRFEICDFWAARSCFSLLLNSLNLSSMECFWAEGLLVAGMLVTLPFGISVMSQRRRRPSAHLPVCWFGVGGSGRTLSGGHRRVTSTVAGSGIAVPPLTPAFAYGTGSCLQREKKRKES
uniref:Uncharacterized protein n=1 Tax=Anopheles merus TaxID=30066 RepID=A0A182UP66_ANOME